LDLLPILLKCLLKCPYESIFIENSFLIIFPPVDAIIELPKEVLYNFARDPRAWFNVTLVPIDRIGFHPPFLIHQDSGPLGDKLLYVFGEIRFGIEMKGPANKLMLWVA
jgi:hypothetical protein